MPLEVVIVALAGMVTFIAMIIIVSKAETEKARASAASEGDSETLKSLLDDNAKEIARLRNRVEVLERLATDEDRNLAGEINRLRSEERV